MVAYLLTHWFGTEQNPGLQLPHLPLHHHSVSTTSKTCGCLTQWQGHHLQRDTQFLKVGGSENWHQFWSVLMDFSSCSWMACPCALSFYIHLCFLTDFIWDVKFCIPTSLFPLSIIYRVCCRTFGFLPILSNMVVDLICTCLLPCLFNHFSIIGYLGYF